MALAGPAANLTLVLLAAVLMRVGFEWGVFHPATHGSFLHMITAVGDPEGTPVFLARMLSLLFSLNLMLGVFNLLPVPPLDGSNVPLLFLRGGMAERYCLLLRNPIFSWTGLIIAWRLSGFLHPPLFASASKLLYLTMPGR